MSFKPTSFYDEQPSYDEQPRLDPAEEHHRVTDPATGLRIFVRRLRPAGAAMARPVLYVHGGTFPSALSIAHRFDRHSWRDALVAGGYDVWAFDCLGFGGSDPYPEMAQPAEDRPALGRVEAAAAQLERVVDLVRQRTGAATVSLVAHSWGTIVAGSVAGRRPEQIDRLVFFGPIARRAKQADPQRFPAWRLVSLQDQWQRFTADVPTGAAPVLSKTHFAEWGERYLDADPASRTRSPASVQVPSGPWQDIADAWAGSLAYDPGLILAPVALIRGEWDSFATDADAAMLLGALSASPMRRDIKIGRATHLMHLEEGRFALYRETQTFLDGGDQAAG